MTSDAESDAALAARLDSARGALKAGRLDLAERKYGAVLETSPENAEALAFVGQRALGRGDAGRAADLFERALRHAPGEADLACSLGLAYRHAGRADDALSAFGAAIALAPAHFVARLFLGEVLERRGDARHALAQYFGAITSAQAAGQWRDEASIPEWCRPLVLRAMRLVIAGRRELFGTTLTPLRERYGRDELRRVEHGLAIYLLDAPPEFPDSRQRPTFFHMPDLPATPWFDRGLFPWLPQLEATTGAIRDELLALLDDRQNFEPFHQHDAGSYLHSSRGPAVWDTLFLYRHGERRDDAHRRCPRTSATFGAVPLAHIPGHAPECLFSVLRAGTEIKPHHGVTNTRAVVHLPLVVPEACALKVGGEVHEWQEGRCVIFDDTFEHEAWNRSDRDRAVLLLDIWNPYLSEAERAAVTDLVVAIGRFNDEAGVNTPRA